MVNAWHMLVNSANVKISPKTKPQKSIRYRVKCSKMAKLAVMPLKCVLSVFVFSIGKHSRGVLEIDF
jgi:hypothetical protein